MEDMPWGAEELVLTTEMEIEGMYAEVGLRRVQIDNDEMTAFHRHTGRNEILHVTSGLVEVRLADDYAELEEGDARFIEAGEPHQVQNIGGGVAELVEIGLPFDPEDVEFIEDPYADLR